MRHTPGPWHVNGIESKRNRITGDETSTGWDKLQINSANRTVATVYRSYDARVIAAAPTMLSALEAIVARIQGEYDHPALRRFGPLHGTILNDIYDIACDATLTEKDASAVGKSNAAPDLYAAAKRLLEPVPGDTMDAAMTALRAAVDRADGANAVQP